MNELKFYDKFLATGFFSGYSPFAPGTMGALVATVIWIIASIYVPDQTALQALTLGVAMVFTLMSIEPINRLEKVWGEDPSKVVVDEMVGVWICLAVCPQTTLFSTTYWLYTAMAFALFRLFDIWKPFGIRKMESIKGGWGVMMDDILAGVYGSMVIILCRLLGLGL